MHNLSISFYINECYKIASGSFNHNTDMLEISKLKLIHHSLGRIVLAHSSDPAMLNKLVHEIMYQLNNHIDSSIYNMVVQVLFNEVCVIIGERIRDPQNLTDTKMLIGTLELLSEKVKSDVYRNNFNKTIVKIKNALNVQQFLRNTMVSNDNSELERLIKYLLFLQGNKY